MSTAMISPTRLLGGSRSVKTSHLYDTLPVCTNTLDVFKCSGCLTLIIYSVEWKLFPYMIRKKYAGWLYPSMIHLIGEVLPRYYGTGTVHINIVCRRYSLMPLSWLLLLYKRYCFLVRQELALQFVWNDYLLEPLRGHVHDDWIVHLIHGFLNQLSKRKPQMTQVFASENFSYIT